MFREKVRLSEHSPHDELTKRGRSQGGGKIFVVRFITKSSAEDLMTTENGITLQENNSEPHHRDDGVSAFIGFDYDAFEIISSLAENLGRANPFFAGRENWYLERHASAK